MTIKKIIIGVCVSLTVICQPLFAEELPEWELGVGFVALHHPHYLGANQEKGYLLALPYFIYRGEVLRADRGGLRGDIYNGDKLDLRLSVGGSLPVNSRDNKARRGMDDLDLLLEIGPTLQYQLYKSDNHLLRADLPVRAGFTVGDEFFYHQGWTANPRFHYETEFTDWTVTSSLGAVFSDHRYHGYIYNVSNSDVTPNRSFYQSASGYTGGRFSLAARRRVGDFFIGGRMTYYNLDGAENEDSPLLLDKDYLGVSFIFAWVLGESDRKVDY